MAIAAAQNNLLRICLERRHNICKLCLQELWMIRSPLRVTTEDHNGQRRSGASRDEESEQSEG